MKKKIYQFLAISVIALVIPSCNSRQKFESNEWKQKRVDWWMTDYREIMVDDLIKSDTLVGMNREQVIKLLGQPESENKGKLEYLIREKYGTNIDPEYISNLLIEIDDNGKVRSCRVEK